MINPQEAWEYIIPKARSYAQSRVVILSPEQGAIYRIDSVDDSIHVSGDGRQDIITIGYRRFVGMINRLNAANGYISRRDMYYVVPFHTVVVNLLEPRLRFVEGNRFIQETDEPFDDIVEINTIEPVSSLRDDTLLKVQRWVNERVNQSAFRKTLMQVYEGSCCITGCKIAETLHACHIIPHAVNGNNQISNGLLLRADIHELFDNNLIGINPETLKIKISDSISDTEYKALNGEDFKARVKDKYIDKYILKVKWDIFLEKNN